MRLAIFDFDGTILRGNSWHEFFRSELRRRPLRAPLLVGSWLRRRAGRLTGAQLRNVALGALRGLTAAEVAALGERLHRTRLAPLVRAEAIAEIETRRAAGCVIVIATGTFDFAVAPFAREVRADHVVATRVAFAGGRCLGRRDGEELLGDEKLRAVLARFDGQSVDWAASCAYSDCVTDAPLLAAVGEPVFVTSAQLPTPPDPIAHVRAVTWE